MACSSDCALNSLKASVGSDLEGEKAAHILSKLASREAERRAQLDQQAEATRYVHACPERTGLNPVVTAEGCATSATAEHQQLQVNPARRSCCVWMHGSNSHKPT